MTSQADPNNGTVSSQGGPNGIRPSTTAKRFMMTSLRRNGTTKTTVPKAVTTATTTVTSTSPVQTGRLRIPEPDPETTTVAGSRKPSALSSPIVIRRSNPGMIGKAKLNTIKITMTLVGVFLACWTPYYVLCIWWVARIVTVNWIF